MYLQYDEQFWKTSNWIKTSTFQDNINKGLLSNKIT